MGSLKNGKFWLGLGVGAVGGWVIAQQLWTVAQLARTDVHLALNTPTNTAPPGRWLHSCTEGEHFTRTWSIENGIERISYQPKAPRFETPLLFQHGMWHGAWCWQPWQELLAEWGWESHAYSLPSHAGSPTQRPLPLCTLDYYLSFLKNEVLGLARRPVLVGHSMGGALTQWYLKYVGDLPAAVLVASWPSHRTITPDNLGRILKLDPLGTLLTMLTWQAAFTHGPTSTARLLITEGALYSPPELQARLGPESILVLYQHNPPFWSPPERINTPMLWLAGALDAGLGGKRDSADHYKADYVEVERAGHNLMMEHNYRDTARNLHDWLVERDIT